MNQARQTGMGAFNQVRQQGMGALGQVQSFGQQGLQQVWSYLFTLGYYLISAKINGSTKL